MAATGAEARNPDVAPMEIGAMHTTAKIPEHTTKTPEHTEHSVCFAGKGTSGAGKGGGKTCKTGLKGGKSGGKCYNCGGVGHLSKECPSQNRGKGKPSVNPGLNKVRCYNCDGLGHRSFECTQPRSTQRAYAMGEDAGEGDEQHPEEQQEDE